MNTLRERYLEQVKSAPSGATRNKQLVGKSATGPHVACLRNAAGEVIGFAPVESLPPDELRKQLVAKSVDGAGDENAIFDSLFEFRPALQSCGVEISKSAEDDPNSDLVGLFPTFLQPTR
jgi:hypothetical protein